MAEQLDQQNTSGTLGIGFGDTGNGRDYMAQGFIPSVITSVTAISFRVNSKDGSANIGYRVWIDAANANSEPTGGIAPGGSGVTEITNGQIVTNVLTKYTLATPVTVVPGNRYAIVMEPWNTVTDAHANSYHDFQSSVSNPYASGRRVHSGDFSSWGAPDSGNADIVFEVWGEPPPPPPSNQGIHNAQRRVKVGDGMSRSEGAR